MQEGSVKSTIQHGVGYVTFFHPQSNSLPGVLLRALADEITKVGNNPEAKVIVLQSEGDKAFCAGASFDELIAISDLATGKTFFSGFAGVINAMRKAPKFVIVRVQGKAVGGGVGLASAGDYTFGLNSSSIKLSELAVGPAVERKVGKSAFTQLTINATEWQDAQWAKRKGLYAETFDDIADMDASIESLCEKLVKSSPEAMAMLKKIMWEGCEHWDTLLLERAEMSGKLVLSDFTKNFIQEFKAKQQKA
jgi:methylglutaconyl-CoA hydratase